jgi:superfamily I DNA and/or RNA helicase
MQTTGFEIFDEIIEIHQSDRLEIRDKYARLRSLLERVCKETTANDKVQFPSLFSRLNFVCTKLGLNRELTYSVNGFRINANKVLHNSKHISKDEYLRDLKGLCEAMCHFRGVQIPSELKSEFVQGDIALPEKRKKGADYKRIRAIIKSVNGDCIEFVDEDKPEDIKKLKNRRTEKGYPFKETIEALWEGAEVNLIDVLIDEDDVYQPKFVVLEPDFLVDISSLAECFKEYGNHPLNYIHSRLEPIKNTKHILLGNAANLFLDELVNEQPRSPLQYNLILKEAFKNAPFEFSTCPDIESREDFVTFLADAESQYQNIKKVVHEVFASDALGIDAEKAVLEPSFICEQLGIQGRLDFFEKAEGSISKIIELKSGKTPFPENNLNLVGKNHTVQAFLYYLVIQYILNISYDKAKTYILYSKYREGNLRNPIPNLQRLQSIINLRNQIVSNDRKVANETSGVASKAMIAKFTPEILITENVNPNFLQNFIKPQINNFRRCFEQASPLELEYFHSFYSFITRELFLSKAGEADYDSMKGIATLWNATLKDKLEGGEILIDLSIKENLSNQLQPTVVFNIPKQDIKFIPNFRKGDVVVIYERNIETDNVTNKQVFKGTIQEIKKGFIEVRLRNRQRSKVVFPSASRYAVEKDFLDSSYNSMFRSMYSFLQANKDRKDLLLNQRAPEQDETNYLVNIHDSIEIQQIVYKAKIAKDYFLLVGPPGTGKTSKALKAMVTEYLSDPAFNILLLSYTNRAVDEMCKTLENLDSKPNYIRIGSELSCDPSYSHRLLDKVIASCERRDEVKECIQKHRIFIGTTASISTKGDLFNLKQFDVAIIDEASQILEPQIIGILCVKNQRSENAVKKFILIGDNKQLPAVVLQSNESSRVENTDLRDIGLVDRRNSLFERLYNLHRKIDSNVWDMLKKQGRMHPEISLFPNYAFYKNKLELVPTPHQLEDVNFLSYNDNNYYQKLLASKRICFIPSEKCKDDISNKVNSTEAKMVAKLVLNIFELYQINLMGFDPSTSLGIITPFRSQIGAIKREIEELGIDTLNNITVDTVERYQGSERDIVIYSFCINHFSQLSNLVNNIEEDGVLIDRKLNVALTRARKQLFIIGNPQILSNNLTYYRLTEFIRSKNNFIDCTPDEFLNADFDIIEPDTDVEINATEYQPDSKFADIFNLLVTDPIKYDNRTEWPNKILGNDHDYNRLNILEYGRTNFDRQIGGVNSTDKVNLYCYFNMRKHYFTSYGIFKTFQDFFNLSFKNTSNRIVFFDFGCGPLTSGLAFNQLFHEENNFKFDYIGIDLSNAMIEKAKQFASSGLFNLNSHFSFYKNIAEVPEGYLKTFLSLPSTVILNFSYLFANLNIEETEKLASEINSLIKKHPLNKFILIYQNSSLEKRNRAYLHFKKLVSNLQSITQPRIETITYRNSEQSKYDRTETVYYEILSN